MYQAIFTQFFLRFSHYFLAHPINLKGLVVFLCFSKTYAYFQGWFYKILGQFQDKRHFFFKFQEFSKTRSNSRPFQVCSNPVRACLILYAILTPIFNLWIYVGVMECAHSFIHCDLDLRSQFLKKCTHSRSPILFMVAFHIWHVDTSLALAGHQLFPCHCDLDVWFQF